MIETSVFDGSSNNRVSTTEKPFFGENDTSKSCVTSTNESDSSSEISTNTITESSDENQVLRKKWRDKKKMSHNSYLVQNQHRPATNRGVVEAIKRYALSAYNKLPHWEKNVKKISSLTSFAEQCSSSGPMNTREILNEDDSFSVNRDFERSYPKPSSGIFNWYPQIGKRKMKGQTTERSKMRNIEQTSNAHWRFPLRRVTNLTDHKECNNVSSEFSSTTQHKYNVPYNCCEEPFMPEKHFQEGMTPSTFEESNLSVLSYNRNSNYTCNKYCCSKRQSMLYSCPKRQTTSSSKKRQSYDDSSRPKRRSCYDFSCSKSQYSISNCGGFCQQICDNQLPRDISCRSSSMTEIKFSASSTESQTPECNYCCQKQDESPALAKQKNYSFCTSLHYAFPCNKYNEPDVRANHLYKNHLDSSGPNLKNYPYSNSPQYTSQYENYNETPRHVDTTDPNYHYNKQFYPPELATSERSAFSTSSRCELQKQNYVEPPARPDAAWPDYCRYKKDFGPPASKSLKRGKYHTSPRYVSRTKNFNYPPMHPDAVRPDCCRYKKRLDPPVTTSPEKGEFSTSPEYAFATKNYSDPPIYPNAVWPDYYRYRKHFDPIADTSPKKDEFPTSPEYIASPSHCEPSKKDRDPPETTNTDRGKFSSSTKYNKSKDGAKPAESAPKPKKKDQAHSVDVSQEKEAFQASTEPSLPAENTSGSPTNTDSKSVNTSESDYITDEDGYSSVDTSPEKCEYVSSLDFESESLTGTNSNSEKSGSITAAVSTSESVSESSSPDDKVHSSSKSSGQKRCSFSPSTDYTVTNENESRPPTTSDQPSESVERRYLNRKLPNSDRKRKPTEESYPSENATKGAPSIEPNDIQKPLKFLDATDYSSNLEDSHPSAPENNYEVGEFSAPANTDISETSKPTSDNTSKNIEFCTCKDMKQNKFCTCKDSKTKLPKPVVEEKKVGLPTKPMRKCLDLDEFPTDCSSYEECHQSSNSCPELEYCENYVCCCQNSCSQNSDSPQNSCSPQSPCEQSACAQSACAQSACARSACAQCACVDDDSLFCFKRLPPLENTSRPPKPRFQPTKTKTEVPKTQFCEKNTEIYETAKECQKGTQTYRGTSTECNCSLSNRTNIETCRCSVKTPSSSDKYEFASSCLRKGKKCKTPMPVPRKKITPVPRLRASVSGSGSCYKSKCGYQSVQSSDSLICNLSDSTRAGLLSSCFTSFRTKSSSSLFSAATSSSSDSSSTVSSCEKLSPTPSGCRPCRWSFSSSSYSFQYQPKRKRYKYCFKKRKKRRKKPHLLSTRYCSLQDKRFLRNKKRTKDNTRAIRLCARKASLKEVQRRRNKARALARQIRPKDKKFYCLW